MANRTDRKSHKGANGTGATLTVYFDCSDPAERKALEAARLLAAKHGRRKQAIIALLEAVYNYYEATGELLSAGEITAGLISGRGMLTRPPAGFSPAIIDTAYIQKQDPLTHTPLTVSRVHRQGSGIEVTNGGKASAETVAQNFLSSMAGFFE